ncbi:MAG: M50 family metallopeptidase [Myxococcales bacterium]|jgi:hypothetical protein|nr:M50 family metallopeptidase [Myxococcales bacterium]
MDIKKAFALVAACAIGVFFWESAALYPLKILTTIFHELGHALAAKFSGFTVKEIVINENGSGYCAYLTDKSFFKEVFVASSGYLGSTVIGAFLLFLCLRLEKAGKFILSFLAIVLVAVCVIWTRNTFGWVSSIGLALALGLAARFLHEELSQLLALFLSAFVGLYSVHHIRYLVTRTPVSGEVADTEALAQLTHIPAPVWAVAWLLFSALVLLVAIYQGFKRPGAKPAAFPGKNAALR